MKPGDPSDGSGGGRSDAFLVCPLPGDVLDELDRAARAAGLDRAAMARRLLGEALRTHAIARAVEEEARGALVIPFPRPDWAVDFVDRESGEDA